MLEKYNDDINFFLDKIIKRLNEGYLGFKLGFAFSDDAISYFKKIGVDDNAIQYLKNIEKSSDKIIIAVENYEDFFKNLFSIAYLMSSNEEDYKYISNNYMYVVDVFEKLWLRATTEDINNINKFLSKQCLFINDGKLNYNNEIVGKFYEYYISVTNINGKIYDENNYALKIELKKDNITYTLPVVRYDIDFENKVCYIGAIQNKSVNQKNKDISRLLYKLNKDVDKEYLTDVYNGSLLSLIIFVNILIKNNIMNIKVAMLHPFSYDYHNKLSQVLGDKYKDMYNEESLRFIGKADLISKAKTENLLAVFIRLLYHFENLKIITEPFIHDDNLNIKIAGPIMTNSLIINDIILSMNQDYTEENNIKKEKIFSLFNIKTK